jgi:hypothetical protein
MNLHDRVPSRAERAHQHERSVDVEHLVLDNEQLHCTFFVQDNFDVPHALAPPLVFAVVATIA